MITVAEYNHADQLEPFERLWNRLLDRTPEPCISHTWDWINSQSPSENLKPRILVAFLGGRPFGVLPLKVESRSTPCGALRCLTSIGEPWFPFAGPLGPNTTAMLAAAFRHVHRTRRDWDMLEFRLDRAAEMLRKRLENAFRLVGWPCEKETTSDWLEVHPEKVMTPDFASRLNWHSASSDPRITFERYRSEKPAASSPAILANCLSLMEEILGPNAARELRTMHHAATPGAVADWCLLKEQGTPIAAAMNLFTPSGIRTMALVGRNESARSRLFERMLQDALGRGEGPYLFPQAEVPFSEKGMHATRRGFRYTHISPWAVRARWQRFRERIQTPRRISEPAEPVPAPHMLTLYAP